jgi:hypothetical protein
MDEKEKQANDSSTQKVSQSGQPPISETIADAHASGDGALERGKDTLIASDDGSAEGEKEPTGGEGY